MLIRTISLGHIGTYDVQRLEAMECTRPNCIQIRAVYALRSPAKGTLILLLPHRGAQQEVDITRVIFLMLRKSASDGIVSEVLGVSPGDYQALAYDIERDGTIHSGVAASRAVLSVRKQQSPTNGMILQMVNVIPRRKA